MTTAADLRDRITIIRPSDELDPAGVPTSWPDVATVWAAVQPLRGREFWAAQAVNAEQTIKVTVRYRPGITSAMRVRMGARTLEITAPPIDVGNRHVWLELLCREVEQ